MNEQVIHIKTPISREDLDAVVTGMEVACGGIRIEVTEVFDLVVEDERQAVALKALFGSNGKTEKVAIKPRGTRQKKTQAADKPEKQVEKKTRTDVLYEILNGPKAGEKYRGPSIALMMKAGNLAAGTALSHPIRGKLIVVTNGQGTWTLQAMVPA
jgi:hypothetical protein